MILVGHDASEAEQLALHSQNGVTKKDNNTSKHLTGPTRSSASDMHVLPPSGSLDNHRNSINKPVNEHDILKELETQPNEKEESDEIFIQRLLFAQRQGGVPEERKNSFYFNIEEKPQYFIYFHVRAALAICEQDTREDLSHVELIRFSLDDLPGNKTIQEAIYLAIFQFNKILNEAKVKIRIANESEYFDMYLAKKNGQKKSFPAIYPFEKLKKFKNGNLVLIPIHASALLSPQPPVVLLIPQSQQSPQINNLVNPNDQPLLNNIKANNINAPSESIFSNSFEEIKHETPPKKRTNNHGSFSNHQNNSSGKNSFTQQGNLPVLQRRSIQSTITPKQAKYEINNHPEDEEFDQKSKESIKCFPFSWCVKDPFQKSNSSSKKLSSALTSS